MFVGAERDVLSIFHPECGGRKTIDDHTIARHPPPEPIRQLYKFLHFRLQPPPPRVHGTLGSARLSCRRPEQSLCRRSDRLQGAVTAIRQLDRRASAGPDELPSGALEGDCRSALAGRAWSRGAVVLALEGDAEALLLVGCDGGLSLGLRQRSGGGDCRDGGGDGAGEDERIDSISCRHGFLHIGLSLHPRWGALARSRYRPEHYCVSRSLIREQREDPRAPWRSGCDSNSVGDHCFPLRTTGPPLPSNGVLACCRTFITKRA